MWKVIINELYNKQLVTGNTFQDWLNLVSQLLNHDDLKNISINEDYNLSKTNMDRYFENMCDIRQQIGQDYWRTFQYDRFELALILVLTLNIRMNHKYHTGSYIQPTITCLSTPNVKQHISIYFAPLQRQFHCFMT